MNFALPVVPLAAGMLFGYFLCEEESQSWQSHVWGNSFVDIFTWFWNGLTSVMN